MSIAGQTGRFEVNISDVKMIQASGVSPSGILPAGQEQEKEEEKGFGDLVESVMSSVNSDIAMADDMAAKMAEGRDVGIAETMIAISKAGISFRMMLQVRNKALSAYEEIMRMQV